MDTNQGLEVHTYTYVTAYSHPFAARVVMLLLLAVVLVCIYRIWKKFSN